MSDESSAFSDDQKQPFYASIPLPEDLLRKICQHAKNVMPAESDFSVSEMIISNNKMIESAGSMRSLVQMLSQMDLQLNRIEGRLISLETHIERLANYLMVDHNILLALLRQLGIDVSMDDEH
jgi:hypothetical protein